MSNESSSDLVLREVSLQRRDGSGGEREVLRGVSAEFEKASLTLVVGPTGSGKSSLVHLLAGLLRPTSGTVYAGGEPLSRWVSAHRDRWRDKVGIAFQEPRLLDHLTALENVLLPRLPRGRDIDALRREAMTALDSVDASRLAGRHAETLSLGERQRVAIARAIVKDPEYLLLDEPTSAQDDEGLSAIVSVVVRARELGAVVVVTTHDPRLIGAEAHDKIYELHSR